MTFDEQGYLDAHGVLHPLEFDPAPFDHGANGVSVSRAKWVVDFREDLSPQERGSLESYLRGLPAVTSVRPCNTRRVCK
ncbi:MAG TPA: hypothetical protein VF486_16970 [Actinomycetes bacterium]